MSTPHPNKSDMVAWNIKIKNSDVSEIGLNGCLTAYILQIETCLVQTYCRWKPGIAVHFALQNKRSHTVSHIFADTEEASSSSLSVARKYFKSENLFMVNILLYFCLSFSKTSHHHSSCECTNVQYDLPETSIPVSKSEFRDQIYTNLIIIIIIKNRNHRITQPRPSPYFLWTTVQYTQFRTDFLLRTWSSARKLKAERSRVFFIKPVFEEDTYRANIDTLEVAWQL